jgi:hypothetical protein
MPSISIGLRNGDNANAERVSERQLKTCTFSNNTISSSSALRAEVSCHPFASAQ